LYDVLQKLEEGDMQYFLDNIDSIMDAIECVLDEEEDYQDRVPENLQSGWRYEESENASDNLRSALDELEEFDEDDSIEDIVRNVYNAINYLDQAT
jgi:hypothetical protein